MATPSPQPISIKSAARKLPIKRKSPESHLPNPNNPNNNPSTSLKIESQDFDDQDDDLDDVKPPPFKFHRIWTESDELRFLQGLLDSAIDGLAFPRDLHLFYHRFSESTPQPYTKSQLSEKLRRLRKKFRVISARIARGLDPSLLSPHDRALLDLSKQLWDPDYASSSPFNASSKKKGSKVRVRVTFAPSLASPASSFPDVLPEINPLMSEDHVVHDDGDEEEEDYEEVGIRDGHGEESRFVSGGGRSGFERIAAKTVMDVFDTCFNEVRTVLVRRGLLFPDQRSDTRNAASSKQEKEAELMKRCREQRVAELDALARRLRFALEHSIHDDQ